ncbi:MAG: histidine kinase [Actinomycetota bacterium]|nr:histidine kinase [Actinomycetota bacterium]
MATRTDSDPSRSTVTYRYRSGRVTIGTFYFLVGVAFLIDSVGLVRVGTAMFWPLFLIALGVGMLLRRARRLQVEEDRSAQLAVAEERVRIARELHDIVAHGVSLMTIQIAAARRVAESQPDAAESSLAAAEETGRQTLNELDSMLNVLRGANASIGAAGSPVAGPIGPAGPPFGSGPVPQTSGPGGRNGATSRSEATGNRSTARATVDGHGRGVDPCRAPLPRLADIPALVTALQEAGRTVSLHTLGDLPRVPASVELVIYRVVQEALTNAARYAGDAAIEVQLIYAPQTITVFVDDDGPGSAAVGRPGGGHGLLGMSERLATFGGSLEAGPRAPGPGWRVYASVPVLAVAA